MESGRFGTRTVSQMREIRQSMAVVLPYWRLITEHGLAGCRELKGRSRFALEIHLRQPDPVQQHDLPLGLAKEAEDSFAMKI